MPADRHPWARLTLEAHLIKLAREGRVGERNGIWRLSAHEGARWRSSLRAVERAARRQWVLARRHLAARARASAGRCWATTAPARRSCSSCLSGDVWPTPTRLAGADRAAAIGWAAPRLDLIDAKARIAYLGGERQDKYARYGWNLRVRDLVATGLASHRFAARAGDARRKPRGSRATLRACGLEPLAAPRIPVPVLRREAPRAAGARAGAGPGLAAARRVLQRPGRSLSGGASMPCSTARAGAASPGSPRRIARMDVPPRYTMRCSSSSDGRVHARSRACGRRTSSACGAGRTSAARRRRRARSSPARRARGAQGAGGARRACCSSCRRSTCTSNTGRCSRDVNWQLRRGEHWAVFGANGAGKSSFLKLLYGDLAPALGGRIERSGISHGHADRRVEAACRLRLAGAAKPTMRWTSAFWIWSRAAATRASVSSMRRLRRICKARATLAEIFQAGDRATRAGRASCPTANCAARSLRARMAADAAHSAAGRTADRPRSQAARRA